VKSQEKYENIPDRGLVEIFNIVVIKRSVGERPGLFPFLSFRASKAHPGIRKVSRIMGAGSSPA
jgi:hypothetical protein